MNIRVDEFHIIMIIFQQKKTPISLFASSQDNEKRKNVDLSLSFSPPFVTCRLKCVLSHQQSVYASVCVVRNFIILKIFMMKFSSYTVDLLCEAKKFTHSTAEHPLLSSFILKTRAFLIIKIQVEDYMGSMGAEQQRYEELFSWENEKLFSLFRFESKAREKSLWEIPTQDEHSFCFLCCCCCCDAEILTWRTSENFIFAETEAFSLVVKDDIKTLLLADAAALLLHQWKTRDEF